MTCSSGSSQLGSKFIKPKDGHGHGLQKTLRRSRERLDWRGPCLPTGKSRKPSWKKRHCSWALHDTVPRCGASRMGKWGLGLQAEGPALAGAWGRAEHPGERRWGRSSSGGPDDTSKLSFCPVLLSFHPGHLPFLSLQEAPGWVPQGPHIVCHFHCHTPGLPSTSFASSHSGSLGLPNSCLVR